MSAMETIVDQILMKKEIITISVTEEKWFRVSVDGNECLYEKDSDSVRDHECVLVREDFSGVDVYNVNQHGMTSLRYFALIVIGEFVFGLAFGGKHFGLHAISNSIDEDRLLSVPGLIDRYSATALLAYLKSWQSTKVPGRVYTGLAPGVIPILGLGKLNERGISRLSRKQRNNKKKEATSVLKTLDKTQLKFCLAAGETAAQTLLNAE